MSLLDPELHAEHEFDVRNVFWIQNNRLKIEFYLFIYIELFFVLTFLTLLFSLLLAISFILVILELRKMPKEQNTTEHIRHILLYLFDSGKSADQALAEVGKTYGRRTSHLQTTTCSCQCPTAWAERSLRPSQKSRVPWRNSSMRRRLAFMFVELLSCPIGGWKLLNVMESTLNKACYQLLL